MIYWIGNIVLLITYFFHREWGIKLIMIGIIWTVVATFVDSLEKEKRI